MNRGVFYISGDDEYIHEARRSAESVASNTSDIDIAIATDAESPGDIFDRVIECSPSRSFRDKVELMDHSPYDRTLYLDTDTYVTGELSPVFQVLSRGNIAVAHTPNRNHPKRSVSSHVPDAFPTFNTGVIAYQDVHAVQEFFDLWKSHLSDVKISLNDMVPDQPAFRAALFDSSVSYHTLPSEYNYRSIYPGQLGGPVKILHGRHDDMQAVGERLNKIETRRVHYRLGGKERVFDEINPPNPLHALQTFVYKRFFE